MNPVFKATRDDYMKQELEIGAWYFLDETWSMTFGPYYSEFSAEVEMSRYCKIVLEG